MIRLMSLLASALIIETIIFGPLGLNFYDISVRKALIASLVAGSTIPMLVQRTRERWQIWLLAASVLFLTVWAFIVPESNNVQTKMTLAEAQPLVALFLVFPLYMLFSAFGPSRYLRLAAYTSAAMATLVIFLWFTSNLMGATSFALAARDFYIGLNDNDLGIYIGPMPDGSFRVTLINFMIFPIMLGYHNWRRFSPAWTAFYAVAIFATGTRAFLGVGAIIVFVAIARRRPALTVPALLIAAFYVASHLVSGNGLRVLNFTSDLTSSSARYVQFFSLMNLFWLHPMLGAGLGANASVIRSLEAPYSYELTYVALLAKLGIVGTMAISLPLFLWIGKLMRHSQNWISIATLSIAIILMTASNPYLINLVGMSLVAFLLAMSIWANRASANRDQQHHQIQIERQKW